MKKKAARAIRSVYDTKTKRYIYNNINTVAPDEPIRLELADAFFHFCYCPERNEHIKIDTLPRQEAGAKYIVTVSNCYWICKRNITVVALLAYATQRAQAARNNLKSAIKEAPTEEVLHAKITEHRCYIDLVEAILEGITEVSTMWFSFRRRSLLHTPYV